VTLNGTSPNLDIQSKITIVEGSSPNNSLMKFDSDAAIRFSIGGTSSTDYSGIIIQKSNAATTQGQVYYLTSGQAWALSDKDAVSTASGLLGFAIGTNSFTDGMMLSGFCAKASHGFVIGAALYLSSTAGNITNTIPTTAGHVARIVGYAVTANAIYFNPDRTWVELS
tara:strand:+ start:163 stop:666 length:504 start_codon:yes stop_codon:yes gene_type:complete